MSDRRRLVSAVTLVVLVGLLVVGALVGWRSLNAPVEEPDDGARRTPSEPVCNDALRPGDVVRSREVTVSVYNAGSRSGLAGQTRAKLENRGFLAGEVGNAPGTLAGVEVVRVLTPSRRDPAALLVARQFGTKTYLQVTDSDLGPGVEVVLGDRFAGLVDAPRRLTAQARGSGC